MNKDVALIVPGAGEDRVVHDLALPPGSSAADVLRTVNLEPDRFQLVKQDDKNRTTFDAKDNVYKQVESGDKLHAVPRDMTVG